MADRQEFHNSDPESQDNLSAYHELIGSIERRNDPSSNTVLIVDDSKLVRRFLNKAIGATSPGVVIYEAGDGEEALAKLEEIREKYSKDPLLIVCDLEMPVMDGWELIEALRKDYESRGLTQGIPIVVLSSSSGEKGFLRKRSVHAGRAKYNPIVSVAKDECLKPGKYDTIGKKGVMAWVKHFLRYAQAM